MEEETKPDVCHQSMGFLQLDFAIGIPTVAAYLGLAKSLTEKQRILLSVSVCCSGAAVLAGLGANLLASLGKTGRVAQSLCLIAGAAVGCAFFLGCGVIIYQYPHLMIWLPSGFSIFITVAFGIGIAHVFKN